MSTQIRIVILISFANDNDLKNNVSNIKNLVLTIA